MKCKTFTINVFVPSSEDRETKAFAKQEAIIIKLCYD